MKILLLSFVCTASPALATEGLGVVYQLTTSKQGACMPEFSRLAPRIAIASVSGSAPMKERVSVIQQRLFNLGLQAKHQKALQRLNVEEVAGLTCGDGTNKGGCRRSQTLIQVSSLEGGGRPIPPNDGLISHEMGHVLCEGALENQFEKISCRGNVSSYCLKSKKEACAEAFASYVVDPNYLWNKCPAAYELMRDQVFSGESASCEGKGTPLMTASSQDIAKGASADCPEKGTENVASSSVKDTRKVVSETSEKAHVEEKAPLVEEVQEPSSEAVYGGEWMPYMIPFIQMYKQKAEADAAERAYKKQMEAWQRSYWWAY